jgi:hypothetical protein
MVIEKTTDEVILRLPADFDTFGLQRILNYLKYKDLIKSSQATEKQITQLSNTSKNRWWEENKNRFIK